MILVALGSFFAGVLLMYLFMRSVAYRMYGSLRTMTDTLTSMYLMDTFADLAIALFSDATVDREVVDGYIDNLTREILTLQEAGQAKSELIHALKRFIDDHAPSSSKANRSDYFVSIPTEDFYSLVQAYKRYDLYDIR